MAPPRSHVMLCPLDAAPPPKQRARCVIWLACVALVGCGGGSKLASTAPSAASSTTMAAHSSLQRCVDLWNANPASGFPRSVAAWFTEGVSLFATVGTELQSPGECAVVIAGVNPPTGSNQPDGSIGEAAQFFHSCDANPSGWCQGAGGPVSNLPTNATQWNAQMSPDGALALGVPPNATTSATTVAAAPPATTSSAGLSAVNTPPVPPSAALAPAADAAAISAKLGFRPECCGARRTCEFACPANGRRRVRIRPR